MATRIGIFGGTFDPIHIGHLVPALDAVEGLSLERLLFVPNRRQPLKDRGPFASPEDRAEMIRRAIGNCPQLGLSLVELERAGASFTLDTMRELRRTLPGRDLIFLTGCDSLHELERWHEPDRLLDEFEIAVMERPLQVPIDWARLEQRFPGIRRRLTFVPVAQLDIQSRELRERVKQGRSIRYLVPAPAEDYIRERGIYSVDAG